MPRDAQLVPALPPGARRVETRGTHIWIRIDGRWLRGHIQCWHRVSGGGWTVWLSYQADPEHPTVAPIWGRFAYDPEAILDAAQWPQPPDGP